MSKVSKIVSKIKKSTSNGTYRILNKINREFVVLFFYSASHGYKVFTNLPCLNIE